MMIVIYHPKKSFKILEKIFSPIIVTAFMEKNFHFIIISSKILQILIKGP